MQKIILEGVQPIYYIDENGNIYNEKLNIYMKTDLTPNGYVIIRLRGYNEYKRFSVHRLLMMIFKPVENMENLVVDHINGIKTDNRLENLEWVTSSENNHRAYATGLKSNYGMKNNQTKLEDSDVPIIVNRINNNESLTSIAKDYGVSISLISCIKVGKLYSWLTGIERKK